MGAHTTTAVPTHEGGWFPFLCREVQTGQWLGGETPPRRRAYLLSQLEERDSELCDREG